MDFLKLFRRNRVSLLPYIREDYYGLSINSPQQYGWELEKFNIPKVWRQSRGEGVIVAVIDTGCDLMHQDLLPNLLPGKNFVDHKKPPSDNAGHGTHVSSTIAAIDNGFGMVGVAPETKIIPVKALGDDGTGSLKDVADALYWVADDTNADFISMSLGSPTNVKVLEDAIRYAYKKGKIIFCAAGNAGETSDIMYPANYSDVISIGAIDENLDRTSFTCSGDSLDFLAPGHNILGCIPGNRYALMSGTSMSNPFAIGCASLLLSYNKKTNKYTLKSIDDYINIFKKNAISLSNPRYKNIRKYEGYGIINPIF
jgi:major intracellular serine protease